MKALFLFLTIFFISFNPNTALSGLSQCKWQGPYLNSLVASGKTPQEAQAIYDAQCKVTAPVSKREIKKKLDCSDCLNEKIAKHKGPTPCLRYVTNCPTMYEEQCKAEKKCKVTHSGSSYTEFKAEENITILPCGNDLYCSEDTKMCEYICDSGFSYNFQSGMCEKGCENGEILDKIDNVCLPSICEENEFFELTTKTCLRERDWVPGEPIHGYLPVEDIKCNGVPLFNDPQWYQMSDGLSLRWLFSRPYTPGELDLFNDRNLHFYEGIVCGDHTLLPDDKFHCIYRKLGWSVYGIECSYIGDRTFEDYEMFW